MIVNSHIVMSNLIRKELKKQGLYLDTKRFAYGNIKPDISKMIKQHPHKINLSLDYIFSKMEELCQFDVFLDIHEFSFQLGIICHYITDFFTFAHNTNFHGTFRQHMFYEKNLNNYIKQVKAGRALADSMIHVSDTLEDYKSYLLSLHELYNQAAYNFERDFSYALSLCISACSSIFAINVARRSVVGTVAL